LFVTVVFLISTVGAENLDADRHDVEDVISQIRRSLELWPTLVEICYFRKDKARLPRTRVRNQPRNNGKS
jgi:hypothetical protein